MNQRFLIIGNPEESHVGGHFLEAALELGLDAKLCDSRRASEGPRWLRSLSWYLLGHRPMRLNWFSEEVLKSVKEFQPSILLSTGLAPLTFEILDRVKKQTVHLLNYLTDDPWNPAHKAPWFLKALPHYNHVFSVRRANLDDLASIDCKKVSYIPFAYSPVFHYPEPPLTVEEKSKFDCDIVFAGGADHDRLCYISAFIQEGFKINLYGGYWDRFSQTRDHYRGMADPRVLRLAISGAKIALCLVRRANRDGNSMRTFEIPAVGGCMLTEDTMEHREIFGEEGKAVLYFKTIKEMIEKARFLLSDDNERQRLSRAAHSLIVGGKHTYRDRLKTMLEIGF